MGNLIDASKLLRCVTKYPRRPSLAISLCIVKRNEYGQKLVDDRHISK